MKKFIKIFIIYKWLVLLLTLGMFVRFYNYQERINFGPEQAISLIVSGNYIQEKVSLLGLPSTQRTTSLGHVIFYPPVFNYSLVPLLVLFHYDPVLITVYFGLLNVFTGVLIFFLVKKISKLAAYFSLIIFLFNDYMINHSMFIWSVNYLPFLSVLLMFMFVRLYNNRLDKLAVFLSGLIVSLSIGVEYIYVFFGFLVGILIVGLARNKLVACILFACGLIIGNLPTIIFDFNHKYYHLLTLWQYLIDTIKNPGQSKISYYQFLHIWPFLAILAGFGLSYLYSKSKIIVFTILIIYLTWNISSNIISFDKPVGMSGNLNYDKLQKTSKIIAQDNPENFNVAMTYDFDSRAHPLRYFLQFGFGLKPLGVEEYPNAKILYVLTDKTYPISNTRLWEINSFGAKDVIILGDIDSNNVLYKLIK